MTQVDECSVADAEKKPDVRCEDCGNYFPDESDESGMQCLADSRNRPPKCVLYRRAIFCLCPDWAYTVRQVYITRKFETKCRREAGDDGLDDDD